MKQKKDCCKGGQGFEKCTTANLILVQLDFKVNYRRYPRRI
jgi:hypothetical protein